uniref:Uncharacterized protein n=1 Tax=Arundo donax TaxID=35708 RepID=A0A0A9HH14_ARUDO
MVLVPTSVNQRYPLSPCDGDSCDLVEPASFGRCRPAPMAAA